MHGTLILASAAFWSIEWCKIFHGFLVKLVLLDEFRGKAEAVGLEGSVDSDLSF